VMEFARKKQASMEPGRAPAIQGIFGAG